MASQAIELLNVNDVTDAQQRFGILPPHSWEEFMDITQVTSRDWVGEQYPLLKGSAALADEVRSQVR